MSSFEVRVHLFEHDKLEYRFCSPSWRASRRAIGTAQLLAEVTALDPSRCQRVVLAGSDPTDHPDFVQIVRAVKSQGIAQIALETTGRPLADAARCETLVREGVTKVFVVVGGVRRKVYEHAMGDAEPESHHEAMTGVRNAIASALEVYLVAPVLKWTADDLEPLLQWSLSFGEKRPRGMLLALPQIDRIPHGQRALVLPYNELATVAARVFRACQLERVEYGFSSPQGVIPCASGGVLDRFGTVFHDRMSHYKRAVSEVLEPVAACTDCSLRNVCRGVEPAYLERFGREGFTPVELDVSMNWKLRPLNRLEQKDYKNISAFENEVAENSRSLVRINGHCNMSCAFCFVDRTAPDFEVQQLKGEIARMYTRNRYHLVLSGGEPTLHPALPELIRYAKELGFRTVEMQSNGVRAADMEYARELVTAGLDKVTVSLHSIDPELSDTITRLPKAFGKTIQSMHNFRRLGVLTQVAHVITKANYEALPGFVRYLRNEFPEHEGHLSICFAIAQGISDLVFEWVIPTFTEIKPHLRDALDYCLETDVGFGGMLGQGGFPPCMVDGDMRYYERVLGHIYRSADSDRQFYKSDRCSSCSFDPWCVGVRRSYVERYGESEITPFQAVINAPAARVGEGTGEGHDESTGLPADQLVSIRVKKSSSESEWRR